MNKIAKISMIVILALASVLTTACDEKTVVTLKQIGEKVGPLTDVAETEFKNLAQAGVIKPDIVETLNRLDVFNKTKLVGAYIGSLGDVTASNKQEVIDKIKEGVDLLAVGILQLPPGSKAAKILTGISISLDSARVAVILINPPAEAPASFSAIAGIPAKKAAKPKGISTESINVTVKLNKTTANELKRLDTK